MGTVNLLQLSGKPTLLTRDAADGMLTSITEQSDSVSSEMVVDFDGIVAITPSFFDQFVGGLKALMHAEGNATYIRLLNAPTHASQKFQAVGRGHGLELLVRSSSEWVLRESASVIGDPG